MIKSSAESSKGNPQLKTIFTMHGVTNDVRRNKFIFRTVSDTKCFLNWLHLRPEPLVDLDLALSGGGDALTIDDATCASRDAALLARKMEHAVTIFVNPCNIEFRRPYFFSILNSILDQLPYQTLVFDSVEFKINSYSDKLVLRKAIKNQLRLIRSEEDRVRLIEDLDRRFRVESINLPAFLNVLTKEDLRKLLDAGVRVENHGWTHGEVRNLNSDRQREEVRLGNEWLLDRFRIESNYYAVPFGETEPSFDLRLESLKTWFLLDERRNWGFMRPGVFNRTSLSFS